MGSGSSPVIGLRPPRVAYVRYTSPAQGYFVIDSPTESKCWYSFRSDGYMHSACSHVDGPRRCIGTEVSMLFATAMFGCVSTHSTTARVSGSDVGYSPAPNCVHPRPVASRSGRQLAG